MSLPSSLLFFLFLLATYAGWGSWFIRLLPRKDNLSRAAATLALGVAMVGIVFTLAYFAGVPTLAVVWSSIAVSSTGLIYAVLFYRRENGFRASSSKPIAMLAVIAGLLLAPAIVGGLQFTLFQGNHFDTFNYLESAASYSKVPYETMRNADFLTIESTGAFPYGKINLGIRPTVAIVYGTFSRADPAHLLGNHYLFLLSFVWVAIVNLAAFVRVLCPEINSAFALVIGGAVMGGFWGQYILDINAWSQIAWLPLLLAVFTKVLRAFLATNVEPPAAPALKVREWIPWYLTWVGMVYYYPEASGFWLAPLTLTCAAAAYRAHAPRQVIRWGLTGALFLFLFIPIIKSNFSFLLSQAQQATSSVTWWYQFFAFFRGRDGFLDLHNGVSASHVFSDGVDFIASLSGCYFVTPGAQAHPFAAAVLRLALMLTIALAAIRTGTFFKTVPSARQGALILVPVLTLLTLEAAYLLGRKQIWSAGKALTYFIPIVLATCFCGLASSDSGRAAYFPRLGKSALWVLLFIQIGTGFNRITGASRENGIHYASPYPSVQDPALKTDFNYADSSVFDGLHKGDQVTLDLDDPFILRFVRLTLYSRGISAASERPILAYWNDNFSLGKITPTAAPTVRLRLTKSLETDSFRRLELIKLMRTE